MGGRDRGTVVRGAQPPALGAAAAVGEIQKPQKIISQSIRDGSEGLLSWNSVRVWDVRVLILGPGEEVKKRNSHVGMGAPLSCLWVCLLAQTQRRSGSFIGVITVWGSRLAVKPCRLPGRAPSGPGSGHWG